MTEEKKSILEHIMSSAVDGQLPEDFNLDDYEDDSRVIHSDGMDIHWADGAFDGVCIYHTAYPTFPDDIQQTITDALESACTGDYEAADKVFLELTGEYRAVFLIDELQKAVVNNTELDAPGLGQYMIHLITGTFDKELFKLGLSLLELFDEPNPEVKGYVRTIGMCDEFTVFCVWNARQWTDGNDEVFALARGAKGWGRIHAVDQLEATTDEIRDWLLYEGVDNQVMPEYSALTCYLKADVAGRLEKEIGHEEFSAITRIMDAALTVGGPVEGIMAFGEDAETELSRYVKQAGRQSLDAADYACISKIADTAEGAGWNGLAAACRSLLEGAGNLNEEDAE